MPPRIAPVTEPDRRGRPSCTTRPGCAAPDGSPLNIFGTLAHHPQLLRRWLVFATHVLAKNTLTPRDRELLILRVGVALPVAVRVQPARDHRPAQRHHRRRDRADQAAGRRTAAGATDDAALLSAADELHDDACISDATWATLAASSPTEQMLDVIFTVGNYHMVSFALNSCGVRARRGRPAGDCEPQVRAH